MKDSVQERQERLERDHPPRVKITYDVETGGLIEKKELPFVVGLFADLAGDREGDDDRQQPGDALCALPRYSLRKMQAIDRDNFETVMALTRPRVLLGNVPRTLPGVASGSAMLGGMLEFHSPDDFSPLNIVRKVPALDAYYRLRSNIRTLQTKAESSASLAKALDHLMDLGRAGKAARKQLQLLLEDPVSRTNLRDSRGKLRAFAGKFAAAVTSEAKVTAAQMFGFSGTTADEDARKLLDLFAAASTAENLRKAVDQLAALATYNDDFASVDQPTQEVRAAISAVLGVEPTDVEGQEALAAEATAILAVLATLALQPVALADAQQAALVYLGLQESENCEYVGTTDASPLSGRQWAEQKHNANCRWFANNMLMMLQPAQPLPGPPSVAFTSLSAVMALLDASELKTDYERVQFMAPLGYFVTDVLALRDQPDVPVRTSLSAAVAIDQRVAQIDEQLSEQLRAIMHAPNFQALEATWRGLQYLVSRAESDKMLKLFVFNATLLELMDDLDRAVAKDQSHIFKMIYDEGYGTLGGEPFGLLVGGYEVDRSSRHIDFLSKMAEIAAAAHAPFIAAASPSLFGLDTFNDLPRPRDLEKIFESAELARFREFRESEDARYVTLVLPHVLLRLPYGADALPAEGMRFEELADAPSHSDFLWGNASFLLAERITNAFSRYGWTAAIRGVEGGGLIEGLPMYTYPINPNNRGQVQLFCPTEVSITDRREMELRHLGFMALCHYKGTGRAAFLGAQTTNAPKKYMSDDANVNATLTAQMPFVLAASRFAHYIRVIMRNKIGSFMTRGNVEAYLNSWIANYVLLDSNASQAAMASYPLSQANVVVTDIPGSPGAYTAEVFLRPRFQLKELTTSCRLIVHIPA